MKKLPKTIYIVRKNDGAVGYFVADTDPASLIEMGEILPIGKYELKQTLRAEGKVVIEK